MAKNTVAASIEIERYKGSRFWAVHLNEELLAVVCYKKGALAIREILSRMTRKNEGRPVPAWKTKNRTGLLHKPPKGPT